jgi:hypothetical protein
MSVRYATVVIAALAVLGGCSDAADPQHADGGQTDTSTADTLTPDSAPPPDAPQAKSELERLAAWMTGTFSSAKQSKTNPTYYHITLVMKRIWPQSKSDGHYLYVEQAVAGGKPYRQRVYFLEQTGHDEYASRVYAFASKALEDQAAGAWKDKQPLAAMTEKDIVEKQGCAVFLKWDGTQFKGATEPKKCASTLNGAAYTTSEVTVTDIQVASWDRGYDTSDAQVWGATAGPYLFDKLQNLDGELKP